MAGRTFAYIRVSTTEQTTNNQIQAIRARGYDVQDNRVISETISGSVQAAKRPQWCKLLERIEPGDTVVVLKLDRLGRDNVDVQQTISQLIEAGIKVVSLDLPIQDLASAEGKLMLSLFSAFAQFERDRLIERTHEGLDRAKAQGVKLGRRKGSPNTAKVQDCKERGFSQSETANMLGLGIATVKRHWNATH